MSTVVERPVQWGSKQTDQISEAAGQHPKGRAAGPGRAVRAGRLGVDLRRPFTPTRFPPAYMQFDSDGLMACVIIQRMTWVTRVRRMARGTQRAQWGGRSCQRLGWTRPVAPRPAAKRSRRPCLHPARRSALGWGRQPKGSVAYGVEPVTQPP